MPQIEKPSATGTAKGFVELNSICDAVQLTTILRVCDQRKKPSYLFTFVAETGIGVESGTLLHCTQKAEKGGLR